MYRRDRRRLIAGIGAALAVVATVVTVIVTNSTSSDEQPPGIASDALRTIPLQGASLAAEVFTPKRAAGAPLLVMPASWGVGASEYRHIATLFARSGYQVVAYAQRGFGGSTGKVDFAGRETQQDASTVISWALQHTRADPGHIGMLGISYGAGVSLLTAAHDPRVRAVAAMSTWANIAKSYDENDTPSTSVLRMLIGDPKMRSSFDPTVQRLQSTLAVRPASLGAQLRAMSASRSPDSLVAELNKNKPAIMLANAFQDSLFDPGQLVDFSAKLTTPKRLELASGDHGGPEASALAGSPNDTINDARAWLDHFLRGVQNGIDTEDPIILRDSNSGELHTYRSWPEPKRSERIWLPAPGATLSAQVARATWTASLRTGVDSGATSGPPQYVPSSAYKAPKITMTAIKTAQTFFWDGPAVTAGVDLVGTPQLNLNLASTAHAATIYVYLYDVTADDIGTLVDMQPYTAAGLQPGKARPVTIALRPISWQVPSNDRLTIVIDTVDERYQSLNPAGAHVAISSTRQHPAEFTAPVQG